MQSPLQLTPAQGLWIKKTFKKYIIFIIIIIVIIYIYCIYIYIYVCIYQLLQVVPHSTTGNGINQERFASSAWHKNSWIRWYLLRRPGDSGAMFLHESAWTVKTRLNICATCSAWKKPFLRRHSTTYITMRNVETKTRYCGGLARDLKVCKSYKSCVWIVGSREWGLNMLNGFARDQLISMLCTHVPCGFRCHDTLFMLRMDRGFRTF